MGTKTKHEISNVSLIKPSKKKNHGYYIEFNCICGETLYQAVDTANALEYHVSKTYFTDKTEVKK